MKTAVVTGGAGFIGSHLAQELAGRGYRVIIVDDLSTGKRENMTPLLDRAGVEFIEDTILSLPMLQRVMAGADCVFHQAAIPSVPRSLDDPLASHQVNVNGTLNVLIAARDNRVRKVVYASSCAVYGNATAPQREDSLPNPQSPYAATKLAGEYYCQVFQEVYRLSTVSLRYFNVFGPRQDPASEYAAAVPRFIKLASKGQPLHIFGDGEQTRDFIFVKDVVGANILAAESRAGGILNIGVGRSTSINELARLVASVTGSKAAPVYEEARAGDIRRSVADLARARSFGYEPTYNLETGLKQTIEESRPD